MPFLDLTILKCSGDPSQVCRVSPGSSRLLSQQSATIALESTNFWRTLSASQNIQRKLKTRSGSGKITVSMQQSSRSLFSTTRNPRFWSQKSRKFPKFQDPARLWRNDEWLPGGVPRFSSVPVDVLNRSAGLQRAGWPQLIAAKV